VHAHPQEQIAHVLSGRIRFIVDGALREVGAGESLYLASNVPHGAETLEAAVVIDTFSPPREDYLAQDRNAANA
jgi:quercetin dioxygenase-like cupin family protein